MAIPGYDIEDLDDELAERLEGRDPAAFLTETERERLAAGESLLDVLDGDDIHRLLEERLSETE